MPRQTKWLLIMAAGLAVFALGQPGNSLATQPGGWEAPHAPPGGPSAPPPATTAPQLPPPTVTVPGAITRDLPPPPSPAPPVVGGGCWGGGLPPGEPVSTGTVAQAPPETGATGGTSGPVTTTPADTTGSQPPPPPSPPPPGETGGTRFIPGVTGVGAPPILPPTQVAPGVPPGYDKPPAAGGVCHDYVGDRIGAPPPQNGVRRSYEELTNFLQSPGSNYTPGTPSDSLTPGTVVQFGSAHVGIVGPDGRLYHYTQAAPTLGIDPQINVNNSIAEVTNKPSPRRQFNPDGTVTTVQAQPYKNLPVKVWHPK